MENDLLEILREHLGEEPSLEVLKPLVEELIDFIEDIKDELTTTYEEDLADELASQKADFEENPKEYLDNRDIAIIMLLDINSNPSLADEIKVEWFKNNFDKINPYKDL